MIKKVVSKNNGLLPASIELAKREIKVEQEIIEKQISSMVALYNIGDKKAFYFITSAEARQAIEYINEMRDGRKHWNEEKRVIDKKIDEYFLQGESVSEWRNHNIEAVDPSEIKGWIKVTPKEARTFSFELECCDCKKLTVNDFNRLFAEAEKHDLTVSGVVTSSVRSADLRMWGRTILDLLSPEEDFTRDGECSRPWGELWTSCLYTCNKIPNDRVFLYCHKANVFFDVKVVLK